MEYLDEDSAQELTLANTELAIALTRKAAYDPAVKHEFCVEPECGEPLPPERYAMGAPRCIDCQRVREAASTHFRRR